MKVEDRPILARLGFSTDEYEFYEGEPYGEMYLFTACSVLPSLMDSFEVVGHVVLPVPNYSTSSRQLVTKLPVPCTP